MEEIADRTEVVLLDDLNPTSLSLSNMIHTSLNGFESGLIRSAITSTATTSSSSATATATSAATTTTAAGTTTTAARTASDSTLPTELRLKNRLERIIRTPLSVAHTHTSNNNNNNNSNKATASTSTNSTNNPDSSTPTTTPKRGLSSRVEKKLLVGVTPVDQDGKSLLVTTATATTTPTTRLGSGTDSSAPLPLPAAPVSDSSPDSSEKDTETIKVDQHLHDYSFYYSPDPMPQRQLYTVGSSLLAKAKVKARALQNNLLSSPPPLPSPPHQQDEHDPLTKLELHKGNQEEGADGRGSNCDGTDVESNASNSNTNTISVGTSQHLKSFHHHHHRHHHRSSVQHDNIIMSDSDPQPDNSHDPSNDSDSTVTDHHPHEALLSPPTPRSHRCSIRSGRDSIGPDHDDERPSSPVLLAAAGTTAAPMTPAATPPLSLPKEIAAGVQEQQQKEAEEEDIVASLGEKADTISKTLVSGVSFEPTAMMTTPHDSAALYEAIFQRQHLTEDAIAGSLHELRQLILAYGIPEQPTTPWAKPNKPTIRSKCWKLLLEVHHVSAQEYISLVKQGKPQEYSKIRNDTFRTLATDRKFLDVVEEDSLIRVLCAFAWSTQATSVQDTDVSFTYVQGMNVLAAPFLYTMTEMEAFYSYSNFIKNCCPLYVQPTLQGVHCGIKLLEECLCEIDVELYDYLKSKRLSAELYAFPSVLTICACTPPLDQVMQLWDFLLAWGIHLNIICIIAQLYLIRDELMSHASPMKLLRIFPDLDADKVIRETIRMVKLLPDELYDLLVRHPYDPSVAEKIGW